MIGAFLGAYLGVLSANDPSIIVILVALVALVSVGMIITIVLASIGLIIHAAIDRRKFKKYMSEERANRLAELANRPSIHDPEMAHVRYDYPRGRL